MESLIIVYYYYDKGYNVFVTIEFFPRIDVMMTESTINFPYHDTQESPGVHPSFVACLKDPRLLAIPRYLDTVLITRLPFDFLILVG